MSGFLLTLLAIMAFVSLGSAFPARSHPGYENVQRSLKGAPEAFKHQSRRELNLEEFIVDTDDSVSEESTAPSSGSQQDKAKLYRHLYNLTWSLNVGEIEPQNVRVKFGLAVLSIRFDNSTGIATTAVLERMMWTDERLSWSPEEFGGIKSIRLPSYYVWTPDMTLYNSIKARSERSWMNLILSSDGSILWIPQNVYETYCAVSTTAPEVTCQYKVGSWTYDSYMVGLQLMGADDTDNQSEQIEIAEFDHSCGATVIEARARIVDRYYPCCSEPYSRYDAQLTFVPRGWGY